MKKQSLLNSVAQGRESLNSFFTPNSKNKKTPTMKTIAATYHCSEVSMVHYVDLTFGKNIPVPPKAHYSHPVNELFPASLDGWRFSTVFCEDIQKYEPGSIWKEEELGKFIYHPDFVVPNLLLTIGTTIDMGENAHEISVFYQNNNKMTWEKIFVINQIVKSFQARKFFDICIFHQLGEVYNKDYSKYGWYKLLHPLHCTKYEDMSADLKTFIDKVIMSIAIDVWEEDEEG